jgi:hypothetical protein
MVQYIRLPGKKKGFYSKCTLWRGEDHILAVDSNYYSENYKRFYFRDFQALVIRKTNSFAILNVVFAILTGICSLFLMIALARHNPGLITFCSIVLPALIAGLAINLAKGPTCTCHLKMPLAVHELPSLCRLRHAHRALAEITPMVEKFQGSLPLDEIKSRVSRREVSPDLSVQPAVTPPPQWGLEQYSGFVHIFLFCALLLDAALTLIIYYSYYSHGNFTTAVGVVSNLVLFILAIASLVKQRGRSLPCTVKGVTWAVMILCAAMNFLASIVVSLILNAGKLDHRWEHISKLFQAHPADYPKTFFSYIGVEVILGVWGLAAIVLGRPNTKRQSPASVENAGTAVREGSGV